MEDLPVVECTRVGGAWVPERLQAAETTDFPEDEFICSPDLAARLVEMLPTDSAARRRPGAARELASR
jgi:hypothetical protein